MDWQTPIALGIVGVTALAFLIRWIRRKPKRGCGPRCHCGK